MNSDFSVKRWAVLKEVSAANGRRRKRRTRLPASHAEAEGVPSALANSCIGVDQKHYRDLSSGPSNHSFEW